MTIRVALAVVAMIVGVAEAASAARLERGQSGVLKTTALACPTHDSMRAVLKTAATNFDAALAKSAGEGCRSFDKGTEVFVVEVPNAILACVRPKGEKSCVWTAQDRIYAID
ncbi:hypothetical protein [Pseudorhodoplanes sinuspersici]|uniref:Uncharacterized protein n=1 Tax=Pseudorhodoplanes sinuspersici TaxID=1235591 RepID=A0A1W6ZQM4_9HYPH|nr:hypothetical protein [Pseudorhodoplanes sinuspersici]ARP99669.1 hypothetical protein CAK95_11665 [Pseudorhodoplanes sinuspersici]RKE70651.1 hypothetical protein DFP91_2892 [Pseudorhodoplanes sinuspersici]